MKKTLSVPEAAALLGITERACWQRVYRNQIPYRRWGRKVLIPVVDLEKFLEALPGPNAAQASAHSMGVEDENS